ncbi:MAG TPA: diguanylate cyclase [Dehalococcoidales bacterium]|nr:diguanylate cyclase [Dehalococcoidales bacterium]
MNLWAAIPLASCIVFTGLFILVIQQAKSRVDKVFSVFLFASAVWSFCAIMLLYNLHASLAYLRFWNGLVISAIPLVVVTYYHFIRAYDNKSGGVGVYIGYSLVAVLLVLNIFGVVVHDAHFEGKALLHDINPWQYLVAAIIIPYLALIFRILIRRYRHSEDAIDRNKTSYLIAGWTILLVISYITPFTPALAPYPIDHVGNLFNALIIAFTISRYKLLDIRFVLRKGLAIVLAIVPIAVLYVGGLLLAYRFFPGQQLVSAVILTAGFVVLLVVISLPLRRTLQVFVDRFFYRETYDYRQSLMSFTVKMGNILNLDQLANEMLQSLAKSIRISHALLLFEDPGSGYFTTRYVYPEANDKSEFEFRLYFDSPVVTWLQKESQVLTLRQIDTAPQFKALWETERESLHKAQLELMCPLKSHGKLVGILCLSSKSTAHRFTQEDYELVVSVASQAGVIVENAQLYSQAMTWAITDGLTRVYNHRYMHECLDKEIARGTRFGTTFSVIMIDIDFFKTYNDTYGHMAGDDVLASVGRIIQSSIRTIDMPFRYGGEEFAVILPETMVEGAWIVAERMREKIEQKEFTGRSSVTASFGIATWPADGVTKEQVLVSADKALYTAKETGRNRICTPSDFKKQGLVSLDQGTDAQKIAISMIFALAATVDAKDHYTFGHSRKVSQYAVSIAQALNLPPEKVANIRTAGLLHDIGKIGIPDSILNKDGPLDDQEWRQIKEHPKMGVEILRYVADLSLSLPAIINHHEHYDGTGYPNGLRGEDIPFEARLLSIADAYDAMTSLRPYHNQRTQEEAIAELKRCAGTMFDPELVKIFCSVIQQTSLKPEPPKLPVQTRLKIENK